MEWDQQRIHSLEKQSLEIVNLLSDCETQLIYTNDPQVKGNLNQQISHLKDCLNKCQKELDFLCNQHNSQRAIAITTPSITFEDLDFVITGLLKLQVDALSSTDDFSLTDPASKMCKNNLTQESQFMLTMGLAQAKNVNHLIQSIAKINFPDVPEKLIAILKKEYTRLRGVGVTGDKLFMDMYGFVGQRSPDIRRQTAGLAVLCYFFQTCDIFER